MTSGRRALLVALGAVALAALVVPAAVLGLDTADRLASGLGALDLLACFAPDELPVDVLLTLPGSADTDVAEAPRPLDGRGGPGGTGPGQSPAPMTRRW